MRAEIPWRYCRMQSVLLVQMPRIAASGERVSHKCDRAGANGVVVSGVRLSTGSTMVDRADVG
jgi:hypothetical protein